MPIIKTSKSLAKSLAKEVEEEDPLQLPELARRTLTRRRRRNQQVLTSNKPHVTSLCTPSTQGQTGQNAAAGNWLCRFTDFPNFHTHALRLRQPQRNEEGEMREERCKASSRGRSRRRRWAGGSRGRRGRGGGGGSRRRRRGCGARRGGRSRTPARRAGAGP